MASPWTTREVLEHLYVEAGHRPRWFAAGHTTLRALGVVQRPLREYLHTLYQFTDDWVVSDARFRAAFGDHSTPLAAALTETLGWYRARSTSAAA